MMWITGIHQTFHFFSCHFSSLHSFLTFSYLLSAHSSENFIVLFKFLGCILPSGSIEFQRIMSKIFHFYEKVFSELPTIWIRYEIKFRTSSNFLFDIWFPIIRIQNNTDCCLLALRLPCRICRDMTCSKCIIAVCSPSTWHPNWELH